MRRSSLGALVAIVLGIAGVACSPATAPSESTGAACAGDLAPRTSRTDYPEAVLYAAGDDLPPVVGDVEWSGGDAPVATTAARAVHLQRFVVLQVRGSSEVSIRMTDGVSISAWKVTAIPAVSFRAGEVEGAEWTSGSELTNLVCVPVADGEWAIRAEITFADDGGGGTFYWRLNVSESGTG